jgi:hypothetical protein
MKDEFLKVLSMGIKILILTIIGGWIISKSHWFMKRKGGH